MTGALASALRVAAPAPYSSSPLPANATVEYRADPALSASLNEHRARLWSWLCSCSSSQALAIFYTLGSVSLPKALFRAVVGAACDSPDFDSAFSSYMAVVSSFTAATTRFAISPTDRDCDRIKALGQIEPQSTIPTTGPEEQTLLSSVVDRYDDQQHRHQSEVTLESNDDCLQWLLSVCSRLERFDNDGTVILAGKDIFSEIIGILRSDRNDEGIQMQLFDLIGAEGVDDIVCIFQRRRQIVAFVAQRDNDEAQQQLLPHSMFSLTSYETKARTRKQRQQDRKMMRKTTRADLPAVTATVEKDVLGDEEFLATFFAADFGFGSQKRVLNEEAYREHFEGWEQVTIPPKNRSADEPVPILASITDVDVWARPAFTGVTQFNRMQSRCLPVAYSSNENILVCAPTGAGKTNVALLCILHEIHLHVVDILQNGHVPLGSLSAAAFKVVYIAPMKALAQEIVQKFSKALRFLGVQVKELTGDMQLSKQEIEQTHIIVTTPEKWDVITRKSNDVVSLVRLLIFDEVHILHDTRGSVVEVLVARTIRQVEVSQSMIRIVGLSATLPNYEDVAQFLRVNPQTGLLVFDQTYRPVPLLQRFIGVTHPNSVRRLALLNEICHEKVLDALKQNYQVMVFVHSRKDTVNTALAMIELSQKDDTIYILEEATKHPKYPLAKGKFAHSSNRDLRYLSQYGIGVHNAGMFREDRLLVESQFEQGVLRVLVTTATLAWGVNLPAHTVIIKGTQIYSAQHGGFIDLSMLDVMQIFGRAGRPQYDDSGEGIIITQGDALTRYLRLLIRATPIESRLSESLADNLNAEINLGTVVNFTEAKRWISYTYLYIRMLKNPMHYGVTYQELKSDPSLDGRRRSLIESAVYCLIECGMLKVPHGSEELFPTDLGRTASFFYISHSSMESYLKILSPLAHYDEVVLRVISSSMEFAQLKIRNEELGELKDLQHRSCPIPVAHLDTAQDKTIVLLQAYISRYRPVMGSLVADTHYIVQSAGRICRALHEITVTRRWSHVCLRFLDFCKMIDRRMWDWETPLRQFQSGLGYGCTINDELAYQMEQREITFTMVLSLRDDIGKLSSMLPSLPQGALVMRAALAIPRLSISSHIQPVKSTVCKITIRLQPMFVWSDRIHGSVQIFRFLAFQNDSFDQIHHSEEILFHRSDYDKGYVEFEFYVAVAGPKLLPSDLFARVDSDIWLGSEDATLISFDGVILPPEDFGHTELLDLHPLPVAALHSSDFQRLYSFGQFNTVQTQCFHTMYHMDSNVLLGAPTGSGKTIVAELAILKLLRDCPSKRVVYIAPLKALARERLIDWRLSLGKVLGLRVVEITGETKASGDDLRSAHVVVTTPEKFDSLSRRWRDRPYIRQIGLVVIDELHLLGADRGPILEVIVSRMRLMSAATGDKVRIVGLSTSLANADDVADWLDIPAWALYNFHPVVRPTALNVHISGFPGSRHYCPRMEMLNKPTYASIKAYSHNKPALVFVSSRRQTRLTALGLISFTCADGDPQKFLHIDPNDLKQALLLVVDDCLRHVLEFGIGLHHAGLCDHDRRLAESLFTSGKIQVLVCTATLAWGVNLPAHLCVIKGTEFFDAAKHRYIDYPITDVIQMMGRAGRPQYRDVEAHACVLVHEPKKQFYKKFLYQPFPIESSLLDCLHDHINAEIQSGQLKDLHDAIDYISWTFLFRRLCKNPTYYRLKNGSPDGIRSFLLRHLRNVFDDLVEAGCIMASGDGRVDSTYDGMIAANFYLHYRTIALLRQRLIPLMSAEQILHLLCECHEFSEIPVRHNEDIANEALSKRCRWPSILPSSSPHTKSFLLLQALMQRLTHTIPDYITDTKMVLDQSARVVQAMLALSASLHFASTTLGIVRLMQCLARRRHHGDSVFLDLPMKPQTMRWIEEHNLSMGDLVVAYQSGSIRKLLRGAPHIQAHLPLLEQHLSQIPAINVKWTILSDDTQVHVNVTGFLPSPDENQFWIGVARGDLLEAWQRIPIRLPAQLVLPIPTAGDAAIELHVVSEQWRGLDRLIILRPAFIQDA